jgi:hypothetical protein
MPRPARAALNARAVNAEPLSVPSVSVPGAMARSVAARSMRPIASRARQRVCRCQATISRVQQTGRGHEVDPAVLGDPDRRHVQMPELIRALDAEEPRPASAAERAAALDEPALAHHAQHVLAVDRPAEPSPRPRRDQSVAVGRVRERFGDDRRLDRIRGRPTRRRWRPPRLGYAVDRLAADLQDARHDGRTVPGRHQLAGVGDALAHSHALKPFPRISSS